MQIKWDDRHAEVGPFKLNIWGKEDACTVHASTPGVGLWMSAECKSLDEAKAAGEKWIEEQLVKFLVDVGINPNTALDGTVKCEPCYGTGRWGSNGAEVHQPCGGTGRVPKGSPHA